MSPAHTQEDLSAYATQSGVELVHCGTQGQGQHFCQLLFSWRGHITGNKAQLPPSNHVMNDRAANSQDLHGEEMKTCAKSGSCLIPPVAEEPQ